MPLPFLAAGATAAALATVVTVKGFAGEFIERNPTSVVKTRKQNIELDNYGIAYSVSFLPDRNDVVCGGREGKIRRWRGNDGQKVGPEMHTGGHVLNIAVSPDGRWIVSGTDTGQVTVWNAETHECVTEIKAHGRRVYAVDISPDGARIATGSEDRSACVWSLQTGERVLGPLKHQAWVAAVKYSPLGDLLVTATWNRKSIRIHNSQNGHLLLDIPIRVSSHINQSLTWSANGRELYALTHEGHIHCLDPSTGASRSWWSIHSGKGPECIALARNGKFIAASANSSISFWDTFTHEQIGHVVEHTDTLWSICLSSDNNVLASGGNGQKITTQSLEKILPQSYLEQNDKLLVTKETDTAPLIQQVHDSKTPVETRISRRAADNITTSVSKTELCSQLGDALRTSMELDFETAKTKSTKLPPSVLPKTNLCQELGTTDLLADWGTDFIATFEKIGDIASSANKTEEAITAYTTALSLSPPMRTPVLIKWTTVILARGSWVGALIAAAEFKFPPFIIYQAICDILEETGRIVEATECLQQMRMMLGKETSTEAEKARWEREFEQRCTNKLERLGDTAMNSRHYSEAAKYYSTTRLLNPVNLFDILIKRSEARVCMGLWQEALDDANEAIALEPSSHRGRERREAILRRHASW